ncbi:MAG TPA: hypothetical protein V6D14_07000 [Coleofasciculaceae cyanobacterium]|jgi:hypothetical protein
MSEDQQKSPESASSEPQTPPPVVGQSETGIQQTRKMTHPTGKHSQPLVKAQGIKLLRGIISLLEGFVEKLEAEPVSQLPPAVTPAPSTPKATPVLETTTRAPEPEAVSNVSEPTSEVPDASTPTVAPKPTAQELATGRVPPLIKPKLTDRLLPTFDRLEAFWDATLQKARSVLPQAWNEKLSDWGLTGAIAGIIVVLLLTTVALLPDTPTQIAKAPPNTIEAPPELKAPKEPQPVEVEPPPAPELTPEQSLIAAIQKQVADITDQYGNGLIQSIEANFLSSRLIVKVTNGWYNLKESQQNNLADEILRRSGELDFSKLEITDSKGRLVARSPVVGTSMVILKRQELAANL